MDKPPYHKPAMLVPLAVFAVGMAFVHDPIASVFAGIGAVFFLYYLVIE